MTCQEVLDALTRRKKNLADLPTATFLDWCDEMNRFAYRVLYNCEQARYVTSETYNVVTGTQSYALPEDFLNIQPYDTGFFIIDANGNTTDRQLAVTQQGSQTAGYFLQGNQVFFTPIPQATQQIMLKYIPRIDRITDLDDTLVIPDEYLWYAVDAADVAYDVWDEDPGAEALADQRFTRKLSEMAQFFRRDPQVFGIKTYSNYF